MTKKDKADNDHLARREARLVTKLARAVEAVSAPGATHKYRLAHVPKKLLHTLLNVLEAYEYGADLNLMARKTARVIVCAMTGAVAWNFDAVPWDCETIRRVMKELLDDGYSHLTHWQGGNSGQAWKTEKEKALEGAAALDVLALAAPDELPPPDETEEPPAATPAPAASDADTEFYY